MNLSAMAAFICGKVNLTEAEDLAAAKGFLARRLEMIWNDQLWKDSLVEYVLAIAPTGYTLQSPWLPAKSVLLLPPSIQRVIGVRTTERVINAQDRALYYRVDYDAWHKQGMPIEQVRLPACVWEFETAQNIWALRDAADAGAVLSLDLGDSDGCGTTRSSATLDVSPKLIGTSDRIDGIRKKASTASISFRAASGLFTLTNNNALAKSFGISLTTDIPNFNLVALLQPGESATIAGGAMIAVSNDGVNWLQQTVIPDGSIFNGTVSYTAGIGAHFLFVAAANTPPITLAASDTSALKRQRIRLVEIPQDATTVSVLGKRACPPLLEDEDEPALQGVENCLMAFAQADLLQRERHYAKADLVSKEAMTLLQQFQAMEVVQQSHYQRVTPECGYADDYAVRGLKFGF